MIEDFKFDGIEEAEALRHLLLRLAEMKKECLFDKNNIGDKDKFEIKYYTPNDNSYMKELEKDNKRLTTENSELLARLSTLTARINTFLDENAKLRGELAKKQPLDNKAVINENVVKMITSMGNKIIDQYVQWINICKVLSINNEECIKDIHDKIYGIADDAYGS